MRVSGLVFVGLLLAGGASAQSRNDSGRISQNDLGRIYEARNLGSRLSNEGSTCLIRKSTKKTECRTQQQWRRLAASLSAGKPAVQ